MIKINNHYHIDQDENNYILCSTSTIKSGKDIGKIRTDNIAYSSTLDGIIHAAVSRDIRFASKKGLSEIRNVIKEYKEFLKEVKASLAITL